MAGGGDTGIDQHLLAKNLASFQSGRGGGGAEDALPVAFKEVDNPPSQGNFRAHHGQPDVISLGKLQEILVIIRRDMDVLHLGCGASIARCHEDLVHARALCDLPGERVFATATANDEYLHCLLPWPLTCILFPFG